MPLPKPKENETQKQFIVRCMEEAKDEYTNSSQRYAICILQWNTNAPIKKDSE